jgi:hypothetical protein
MSSAEQRWLRFELRLADAAASGAANEEVQLTVRASGVGEEVSTSPGARLPGTGFALGDTVFAALGAITVGLLAAGLARAIRRRPHPGRR